MKMSDRLLVRPGRKVALADFDPDETPGYRSKRVGAGLLERGLDRLAKLQYLLYAENRRALLVILQSVDTGGKDGTIRHVMSGLNPSGCRVKAFGVPSPEELNHDFLWRVHAAVPPRGEVGIFNRSHYEDVIVVRVHGLVPRSRMEKRYDQINEFERYLAENDVKILKFFLHISKGEQRKRLQERIDDPTKHWKLAPADFEERKRWGDTQKAYELALSRCSTPWAPWYVVPANKKWFRNLAVEQILVETLESMKMKFPKPSFDLSQYRLR